VYAAVLSGALSITVAYFGYKFFVFKTRGRYLAEWFRCVIVYGTAMLPGLVLLPLLVEGLHLFFHLQRSAPYVGGALMTGFTATYSFLGHKHFTFRVPGGRATSPVTGEAAPLKPQASLSGPPDD
jgi:putative flippase GtrA